ncbi:uncharacterized protein LOC128126863 [Lactuca sativa]|uniref:uncharacterized protein LOC128126863 n=1 Tax=Lactuca sativa TaxID=4236 RepID=UPI0022AF2E3D|nr:uncharacterized protein LOC128126863 [Lactuca sativa]
MVPKKRPNKKNNNSSKDPTPPPPPQFNPAMFQAAVTAAVTVALSQINPGGFGGSGIVHATTTPAAATAAQAPTSGYTGTLPWCSNCSYHQRIPGPCREMLYNNCGKKGHTAQSCRTPAQPTNQASGAGVGQDYYGCGEVGHYKRNCPKVATTGNTGRVLAMGQ